MTNPPVTHQRKASSAIARCTHASHAKKGQIIRRRITICPSAGGTGRFVPSDNHASVRCAPRRLPHSNFPKKRLRQCVSSKFLVSKSENFVYFCLSARLFRIGGIKKIVLGTICRAVSSFLPNMLINHIPPFGALGTLHKTACDALTRRLLLVYHQP